MGPWAHCVFLICFLTVFKSQARCNSLCYDPLKFILCFLDLAPSRYSSPRPVLIVCLPWAHGPIGPCPWAHGPMGAVMFCLFAMGPSAHAPMGQWAHCVFLICFPTVFKSQARCMSGREIIHALSSTQLLLSVSANIQYLALSRLSKFIEILIFCSWYKLKRAIIDLLYFALSQKGIKNRA